MFIYKQTDVKLFYKLLWLVNIDSSDFKCTSTCYLIDRFMFNLRLTRPSRVSVFKRKTLEGDSSKPIEFILLTYY